MRYQAQNLDVVTLATAGIDASQTTLPLAAGEGAKLASTAGGSYPLIIWDSTLYHNPHDDTNAEIVLVTSHDGASDTLAVIARGQESTSGVAHNSSGHTYKAVAGFTKLLYDDLKLDVQEESSSVVADTNVLNFEGDDFTITDETGGAVGVAFNHSAATNQELPCAAHFGANQTYGSYTLLRVYCVPVWIEKQLAITKCYLNASASGWVAGTDRVAIGLFDESGTRLLDSTWIALGVAGNYGSTISSTSIPRRIRGWIGISFRAGQGGGLWGRSFGSTTIRPFMNSGNGLVVYGANSCTDGAAGAAAMPATLGTLTKEASLASGVAMPIMILE